MLAMRQEPRLLEAFLQNWITSLHRQSKKEDSVHILMQFVIIITKAIDFPRETDKQCNDILHQTVEAGVCTTELIWSVQANIEVRVLSLFGSVQTWLVWFV